MIAEMTRVELVCLSSIRNQVVASLQAKGLLDLEEVPLEEAPGFLDRVELEGEDYDSYVVLDDAERTANEVLPLLSLEPGAYDVQASAKEMAEWPDERLRDRVKEAAEQLRSVTRDRAIAQDQIEVLNNYKGILEQVAPALGGTDVTLGRGTRAIVLTGNVKKVVAKLEERLRQEIGPECAFHKNQTSRKHLVGLISFPEPKEDAVSRILGQEGITPVDMRDQGFENATIADVLGRIDRTIEKHTKDVSRLEGETNKISRTIGGGLRAAKTIVSDRLARLRVQSQFAESRMVTVIQGWTPADQFDALERAVEEEFPGKVDVTHIGYEDVPHARVPTLLRNSEFFRPFEVVMKLFSPPTYGTVDPTWMVGLSFTVFYGFILGDAFYGLVIVLLGLWIKQKWGKNEIINSVGQIGIYMGVSSIIFGVLYGEYFGNLVEKTVWPALFGHELHPLFHRAEETTQLLVLGILFGVILVPSALLMGVREELKHGHAKHAIEKGGMCLGLLALMFYVFGYFGVPVFDQPFMLVVDAVMGGVGIVMIFYAMRFMGLIGLLEIMSLGGNVLSYARLMALGVASIALAQIANMLPGMMGYIIGIPMALLVHVLNIGIGIASPTIHSLRLNFVEFLPKFYSPEGRGFNPFRKEAQW